MFIDDYSRYTWLYPLKTKFEITSTFIHFKAMAECQFSTKIKILRSVGGKEFFHKTLISHLNHCGIQYQFTYPYTPEQNGVSERKYQHLLETTRALLIEAHLSPIFWSETHPQPHSPNSIPITLSKTTPLHSFKDIWLLMLFMAQALYTTQIIPKIHKLHLHRLPPKLERL